VSQLIQSIRPATAADIAGIQAVGAAAWRDTYTGLAPDGYITEGFARAWAHEGFVRSLANPQVRLLVAELAGEIVGMAQLGWTDTGIAHLWRLYLRQDQRGQGLGKRLWAAITADLPPYIRTYRTSVMRGNPALRFYERLGFGVTHSANELYLGYLVPLVFIERPVDGPNTLQPVKQAIIEQDYATAELNYNAVMEPAYRAALATLALPQGSRGLDLGCGPGGLLPLLAEQVGPEGRVIGVDVSQPHLNAAQQVIAEHNLSGIVRLEWADLQRPLPFADGVFDWIWSADVIRAEWGFAPLQIMSELRRVTRPGGRIAIWLIAWERSLCIPGEAELDATLRRAALTVVEPPVPPMLRSERTPGWLREAGLADLRLSVHPVLLRPPFNAAERSYLEDHVLANLRTVPRERVPTLDDATWARWERLRDPESPDYLFAQPDYYCVQFGLLASGAVPSV
jgi:SAM-dependent methyltransferase/ribosomal protein S18 acetylase RimI-like enzyme